MKVHNRKAKTTSRGIKGERKVCSTRKNPEEEKKGLRRRARKRGFFRGKRRLCRKMKKMANNGEDYESRGPVRPKGRGGKKVIPWWSLGEKTEATFKKEKLLEEQNS